MLNYCSYDIENIIIHGRANSELKHEEENKRVKKILDSKGYQTVQYNWKKESIPCIGCQRPVINTDLSISACCNYKMSSTIDQLNIGKINEISQEDFQQRKINNKIK